jgi:single-stranded DNA-binding protein
VFDGYICKQPVYRLVPSGYGITDVHIAINRAYKSDYIPCIAWNDNAGKLADSEIGTHVSVSGRIQSREYMKKLDELESEKRVAYEVSVSKLEYV